MHILPECRRLLTVATAFCFIACNSAALAETTASSGGSAKGINLDLTSTVAVAAPRHLANTNPVNIVVGGNTQTITSSSQLTPAERLAVFQVMRTGQQSIQVGAQGNAVGGSFTIGSRLSQHISNLVIPAGVTAIDNASQSSTLNLTGNLTNAGNLYVLSTNPAVTSATISAANINNLQGALLSTILPTGGLPGFFSALTNLNLSLNAVNNIVNVGRILSAGNLTATAGGSITNTTAAVMRAVNSVNLISQIGTFVNAGSVVSQTGNLNFSTGQLVRDMTINNLGGTLQALNGAINFRDSSFSALSNLSITGGDFLSKELNLNSGQGTVDVAAGNITGLVNLTAGCAHVLAETPDLRFGSLDVSGDPTYYNPTGSITLSLAPAATNGQDLAFIAAQDVIIQSGTIDTTQASGNAGNLTIVAGALFGDPTTGGQVDGDITTTVSITGGSATGGAIVLTGTSPASINTQGTGTSSNGGNVTLVAFSGTPAGSLYTPGTITVPNAVNTGGSGTGSNGNVLILAGCTGGTAITTGAINTTGGAAGTGTVNIQNTTPTFSPAGMTITNGVVTGAFHTAPNSQLGSISTGSITTTGANVNLLGGSYSIANPSSDSITTTSIALDGGSVLIFAPNGITTGAIYTSSTGGNGGSVVALTGNNGNAATLTVGDIDTSGASGGLVELVNSAAFTSSTNMTLNGLITTQATAVNGLGGPVAIVSSGKISFLLTGNTVISTQATALSATSAHSGGVFISSGSTSISASGAVAFGSGDTINTSTGTTTGANIAGNIIVLSLFPSTQSTTTTTSGIGNIGAFTAVMTGGVSGTSLLQNLDSAAIQSLPTTGGTITLNLSKTANTGTPGSGINISPGGYQTVAGASATPVSLTILGTAGDTQMVIPINIGAADSNGNSLYLSSITGASGSENVSLVLAGGLTTTGAGTTTITAHSIGIYANGNDGTIGAIRLAGALNLSSSTDVTVADLSGNAFWGSYNVKVNAGGSVRILGNVNTNNINGGNGGAVTITAGSYITTGEIDSYSTTAAGGAVTLTADSNSSITTGAIESWSTNGSGGTVILTAGSNINTTGEIHSLSWDGYGGAVTLTAGSNISVGEINSLGINGNGGAVTLTAGSNISTALIGSLGLGSNGNGGAVVLTAGSNISTGNIGSFSTSGSGGAVILTAGSYISTSDIYSNSDNGNAGAIVLTAGSYISTGNINSYAQVNAGAVVLTAGSYITTGDITSTGGGGGGNGGAVTLTAGLYIITGDIYSPGGNGSGGAITLTAGSYITTGGINSFALGNGGAVTLTAGSYISTHYIYAQSTNANGGSVTLMAGSYITTGNITSCSWGGSDSTTGGNVELVSLQSNITIGGSVDTHSSGSNSVSGSVALMAADTITVSGINTAADASDASSLAGNVFVSTGASSALAVSTGAIDTSAAGGGTVGQIFLGANVSGTNGPGTASQGSGYAIQYSTASGTPLPYLFYPSGEGSITSITVTPGFVNIRPGIYAGVGTSNSPVAIILDLGGDSRTLVPIASSAGIYLSGFTTDSNVNVTLISVCLAN